MSTDKEDVPKRNYNKYSPVIFRVKHFKSLFNVITVFILSTFLLHQSHKLLRRTNFQHKAKSRSTHSHLEVHGARVVLVHLADHLDELLLGGVLAHGPEHNPQLLVGDALVAIHIKQVENCP